MIFLIIALILAALAVLSYCLKLKLHIVLSISPDKKFIALVLYVGSIQINEYKLALQTKNGVLRLKYYKKGELQNIFELKDLIEGIKRERPKRNKEVIEILDMFMDKRKLVIELLKLRIDIGLDDAMYSAMLHGAVISVVNTALSRLYSIKGIPKETRISITPHFDKALFTASAESLMSIRLCYLLMAWIRISLQKSKEKNASKYGHVNSRFNDGPCL